MNAYDRARYLARIAPFAVNVVQTSCGQPAAILRALHELALAGWEIADGDLDGCRVGGYHVRWSTARSGAEAVVEYIAGRYVEDWGGDLITWRGKARRVTAAAAGPGLRVVIMCEDGAMPFLDELHAELERDAEAITARASWA